MTPSFAKLYFLDERFKVKGSKGHLQCAHYSMLKAMLRNNNKILQSKSLSAILLHNQLAAVRDTKSYSTLHNQIINMVEKDWVISNAKVNSNANPNSPKGKTESEK